MKKKDENVLKYVGLGLAGLFLLSKLRKSDSGDNSTELVNVVTAPIPGNIDISSVKVLPEIVSSTGAKMTIYLSVSNALPTETEVEKIEGSLYWGPVKIASINLIKTKIEANGSVIPLIFMVSLKTLPKAVSDKIKAGTWLPDAYIKGTLTANGVKAPFQRQLQPLNVGEINGINRAFGLSCCSEGNTKYGLPYIHSIPRRRRLVIVD